MKRFALVASLAAALVANASLSVAGAADESLTAFLRDARAQDLARDPTRRTTLDRTGAESTWTPLSDAFQAETLALHRARLASLRRHVKRSSLSASEQQRYDLYAATLENQILREKLSGEVYFVDGNTLQTAVDLPKILIGDQRIADEAEARNYIARLQALPAVLQDALAGAEQRAKRGIVMMKAGYAPLAHLASGYAQGAPCTGDSQQPLLADFRKKVDAASLDPASKPALLSKAEAAIRTSVCPAFAAFSERVTAMAAHGRTQGLWTQPDGRAVYRELTTLFLNEPRDPHEVFKIGQREVERLEKRVRAALEKVGYTGPLAGFEAFADANPKLTLPNTPAGRREYTALGQRDIDRMYTALQPYFLFIPKAPLVVRQTTHGPFGAPNTSASYYTFATRGEPAYYNLGVPATPRIPTWPLATIAHHEGLPGHHLQIATFDALHPEGLGFEQPFDVVYADGWAAYAQEFANEIGSYADDPYGQIGCLASTLEHAVRLVLDTGLNYEHWTVEQAQAYAQAHAIGIRSVDRFLNWPGHALGYHWGYLAVTQLREQARKALGARFDLRNFHAVLLENGQTPLPVLRENVQRWIADGGNAPSGQPPPAPELTLHLRPVRDGAAEVSAIAVRGEIEGGKDQPLSLAIAITHAGRKGIADRITGLAVSDTQGPVPLAIENDPENPSGYAYFRHWRATRPVVGTVSYTYRALPKSPPSVGPVYELYANSGGVSFAGVQVFVLPEHSGITKTHVRWDLGDLAPGSVAVSTYGEGDFDAPGDGWGNFRKDGTVTQILDADYMAGNIGRYGSSSTEGFHAYWLGTPSFDPNKEMAWTRQMYDYLREFYRDPVSSYRAFVRIGGGGGTAAQNSFMTGVAAGQGDPAIRGRRYVYAHEMGHYFLGWLSEVPFASDIWYGDGINEHFTPLLLLRSGLAPVSEYLDKINEHARRYYSNPYRNDPNETLWRIGFSQGFQPDGPQNVGYTKGALFFDELDWRIREKSGGARKLEDMMRPLLEQRRHGQPLTLAALRAAIEHELGDSGRQFFESVIIRGETLIPSSGAFGPCFERKPTTYAHQGKSVAGYRWVRVAGVPDERCRQW